MIPGLLSKEPFIPHTLEHLTAVNAFPSPLPPAAYEKMLSNYRELEGVNLSRITYNSDTLAVTGLLAEPKHWEPRSHPLMIYNRGGSREFGMLTLLSAQRSMIPFAKRGYIVAASNYRGNDGGEGREEFGGSDVHDVLNIIESMRSHPGFDGRNVVMVGHSRGAMMTYLAMRHGADIRAAAGLAGMADVLQTARERPDIEDNVFRRLIGVEDDQIEKAYIDRSAVYWADELSAPIQLHHGDADNRVDVSQSQRLADALHNAGKTCELHVYPGDNHALLRNWDLVTDHIYHWMERFRL
jgi:dipeptidyl aminopeptidase/acylaminoacyl peptidase